MEKTIGGRKVIFKSKLSFFENTKLEDLIDEYQKGTIKQSDLFWSSMEMILVSYGDLSGAQALEEIKDTDDGEIIQGMSEAYQEIIAKIADQQTKKKK